jgi:hypothetical protein
MAIMYGTAMNQRAITAINATTNPMNRPAKTHARDLAAGCPCKMR